MEDSAEVINWAKDLSYDDLPSHKLYKDGETRFWNRLFELRNNKEEPMIEIKNKKDFVFLEDLVRKTQITPLDDLNEVSIEKVIQKYPLAKKIIDYLRKKEIQAYLSGARPIYYGFRCNLSIGLPDDLVNTTIMAYSKEGIALKYTRLYKPRHMPEELDYFVYATMSSSDYWPFNNRESLINSIKETRGGDYQPSEDEILFAQVDAFVKDVTTPVLICSHVYVSIYPLTNPPRIY